MSKPSQPQKSAPCVTVREGTEIGFRAPWTSRDKLPTSLATVSDEIKLSPGFHLLLARNGRGKTTFLKTLAGCLAPLSGDIEVNGQVQYISEDLKFDPELTPQWIFRSLFDGETRKAAQEIAEKLELPEKTPYGKLSKGNRQKLAIVIAEAKASESGPQILLLDEPFSGVDFYIREQIGKLWSECDRDHVRVICLHPDERTLKADGAMVINDGALRWSAVTDGEFDWAALKPELN